MIRVERAAVLGAGTMGAQIAAHLANAHIPTLLLDIVPQDDGAVARHRGPQAGSPLGVGRSGRSQDSSEAETRPLGMVQEQNRNRIAPAGFVAAKKSKPAAFFSPDFASLVPI